MISQNLRITHVEAIGFNKESLFLATKRYSSYSSQLNHRLNLKEEKNVCSLSFDISGKIDKRTDKLSLITFNLMNLLNISHYRFKQSNFKTSDGLQFTVISLYMFSNLFI